MASAHAPFNRACAVCVARDTTRRLSDKLFSRQGRSGPVVDVRERQSSRTRTPNRLHQPRETNRSMRLSPHAFQQQERVRKAILMLRPGRPVVETGSPTSFVDQTHFTRAFKRQMGATEGLSGRVFMTGFGRRKPTLGRCAGASSKPNGINWGYRYPSQNSQRLQ